MAIIAEMPEEFEKVCEKRLDTKRCRYTRSLPIIDPEWGYEEDYLIESR